MSDTVTTNNTFQNAFIGKMVHEFYTFMADVFIEYNNMPEKYKVTITKQSQSNDNTVAEGNTVAIAESNSNTVVEEKREQTFAEYFLFKLYYNYGVRRRMINEHIALLYYVKSLKGYKSSSLITMLCRHMMLDLNNMRIVSLGIPKAMKIEEFANIYNIDMDSATENYTTNNSSSDANTGDINNSSPKFRVYKFPEGTMITYNPSLKQYNAELINTHEQHNGDDEINGEEENAKHENEIQENLDKQFNKLFEYSTRKVVGTGRFSSTKTFLEMFNENNTLTNTNLDNIPADIMKDKVLVFNIEHPENRIISNQLRNFNTLCGVFQFKTHELATANFKEIIGIEYNNDNINSIREGFNKLGTDMITQIHFTDFMQQVIEYGVNLHMPEVIVGFEGKKTDGTVHTLKPEELSLNQLVNIANSKTKDFQGYIIYGINGERTKIMNNKYKEMKILKGNKPIVLEQWNTKNLFYLYWRLIKLQLIPQFIAEFDETGGWSYNQWFASVARGYAMNLFKVYHNSFVKKSMDKHNIPYSMKPLCGDLHKMYRENKLPISHSMVEQYIFQQPAGKIFWRLFSGK
jgi:hypothetical protein